MMNLYYILNFFIFLFLSGIFVFLMNNKYFLINLLAIEYMMLMLLSMYFFFYFYYNIDFFFVMMFLVFIVIESVIGLSLLIAMMRNYGNLNLMNLFFLKI